MIEYPALPADTNNGNFAVSPFSLVYRTGNKPTHIGRFWSGKDQSVNPVFEDVLFKGIIIIKTKTILS